MLGLWRSRRTRSVRCAHGARTTARSQSTKALRAAPKPCAPRRLPRGPKSNTSHTSLRIGLVGEAFGRCAASRVSSRRRRREAQGFAAGRVSAPPLLTSRGCLSAAPAGRVASSARGCKDRASQRTPRAARGDVSGSPLLGHFFWRDRRSDSPAGARPGLPQQRAELRSTNREQPARFDRLSANGIAWLSVATVLPTHHAPH